MDSWLISILGATVLYGGLNFLFKAAAEKGYASDCLVNVVGGTVALLAFGTLLVREGAGAGAAFSRPVFFYAFFNGIFFALGSLAKFGALKRSPAAIVFPLNRLNTLFVIGIGFVFFNEVPEGWQFMGMLAGVGVLAVIGWEQWRAFNGKEEKGAYAGIALALGSAVFTSLSMTAGKLLAESSANRIAYIGVSYSLVFFFTLGRYSVVQGGLGWMSQLKDRGLLTFGVGIGLLNYVGYFLVLEAFGSGPISLSQAIFSSSIIIPILLSRLIYKERLTLLRMVAVGLAVLAVILLAGS